jgi:hypothetical protein
MVEVMKIVEIVEGFYYYTRVRDAEDNGSRHSSDYKPLVAANFNDSKGKERHIDFGF